MHVTDLFALEPAGPSAFVGRGPRYPWGGLYGGQIVAQALRAAWATVDDGWRIHSLHAYFVRRGDPTAPIAYDVDRARDGRSYATRRVVATQAPGPLLTLEASFTVDEGGPVVQDLAPPFDPDEVPHAAEDGAAGWSDTFRRVQPPGARGRGRLRAWYRAAGAPLLPAEVAADPVLGACLLTYVSDDLPSETVVALHPAGPALPYDDPGWDEPGAWRHFWSASLDHAIWFHAPVRADEWLCYAFACDSLHGTRAVSSGRIHRADGTLVATVAQEVAIRVVEHRP